MIGAKEFMATRVTPAADRPHRCDPQHVWVHVLDADPDSDQIRDAQDSTENYERPQLLVAPGESVTGLDFRVLFEMNVHVIGKNKQRVLGVAKRTKIFNPLQVIASGFGDVETVVAPREAA